MNFKIHGNNIEQLAIDQMTSAMSQPYVMCGALMPDCHAGYALPIGAVVATDNVIVPAWVGYDIGCGMSCTQLSIHPSMLTKEVLQLVKERILERIPVGFAKRNTPIDWECSGSAVAQKLTQERAVYQLGTLGSGNHFIELGYCDDHSYITIHSGSRGYGHGIASHYMKLAANGAKNPEGHYGFDINSVEGEAYFMDALDAQEFALANRLEMSDIVIEILQEILGIPIMEGLFINRHHNHVEKANIGIVHRKGATHAAKGMYGVIPANMRDGCFIVEGKGNPDFLCSSSHGAGRVLSRSKAKKTIKLETMQEQMKDIIGCVSEATLDEAPDAYKNIYDVMEAQKESVEIIKHVKPLLNIKG